MEIPGDISGLGMAMRSQLEAQTGNEEGPPTAMLSENDMVT